MNKKHFHVWSQTGTHFYLESKFHQWWSWRHLADCSYPPIRGEPVGRVSQSDESIWWQSEVSCGWLGLFDGPFPGWLMVFWMTDEVDDLVECVGVPELIDWTLLSLQAEYQSGPLALFCHFYPPCFPLSAFLLLSHVTLPSTLCLYVSLCPSRLCLFSSPFPFNTMSLVLPLYLRPSLFSLSLYSVLVRNLASFLTLFYFWIHFLSSDYSYSFKCSSVF